MKLRPEFEKECLKAVINDIKKEIAFGLDNAKNSEALLEADTWIDIYDKETDEIYSINYSWDWSNDEKEVSVVAYPTEEYKENGETYIRELTTGDCVIILGDDL